MSKMGDKFSEGARRLWLYKGNRTIAELTRTLQMSTGMISRHLSGHQLPSRESAHAYATATRRLKPSKRIEPQMWSEPPTEDFAPPAAEVES